MSAAPQSPQEPAAAASPRDSLPLGATEMSCWPSLAHIFGSDHLALERRGHMATMGALAAPIQRATLSNDAPVQTACDECRRGRPGPTRSRALDGGGRASPRTGHTTAS